MDIYDAINISSKIMNMQLDQLKERAQEQDRADIAEWLEQQRALIQPEVPKPPYEG